MTSEELAYTAGFFDGEGSISIIKYNPSVRCSIPTFSLVVKVTNNDKVVLEQLKGWFGGSVSPQNRGYRTYEWQVTSLLAKSFLEQVLPYLIIKKDRACLGIEFQKHKSSYKKLERTKSMPEEEILARNTYRERIHELNFSNRRYISLN